MGLPSWAHVGAKVVYRGGYTPPNYNMRGADAAKLTKGSIYTIRELVTNPYNGEAGVFLVEVTNELHPTLRREFGYYLKSFRPLVTIEDDIEAHFAHHLTTSSPQGVDA